MKIVADSAVLTGAWAEFDAQSRADGLGRHAQRAATLSQQPGAPGLLPVLVDSASWERLQAGVLQRVALLERVLADCYGAHTLLDQGLLPAALVPGHPGYVHALQGYRPQGGTHLHALALDVALDADGVWWLLAQQLQAPCGLGELLDNRQAIAPLFPGAFSGLRVQQLAAVVRRWLMSLRAHCPQGERAHLALWTPGPYNAAHGEHARLARTLGLTLVQGQDMVVHREQLFLKTLRGLEPVHGLVKWVDDAYCDPLELRAESILGVPGLLQVLRAGNLLMANAPGTAFLESAAIQDFLPDLSQALLGAPLLLPGVPGGGEAAAQAGRFLGRTPVWCDGVVQLQPCVVRVYALSDGPGRWRVLPGGRARVFADADDAQARPHMGARADVWVLGGARAPTQAAPSGLEAPIAPPAPYLPMTPRAAENLFWFGRYAQRSASTVALARVLLDTLASDTEVPAPLLRWLHGLALAQTLLPPGQAVPSPSAASRHACAQTLATHLPDLQQTTSVGFNLRALRLAAAEVREHLSAAQWARVRDMEIGFLAATQAQPHSTVNAQNALDALQPALAAVLAHDSLAGAGAHLCETGRHIEQLTFCIRVLDDTLAQGLLEQVQETAWLEALCPGLVQAPVSPDTAAATLHRLHQQRAALVQHHDSAGTDPHGV